ncbi:hypothetical protein HYH03_009540 [Edaphochlamys debaryana]|uniref:Uncharacterized protein n=1 Tax=Edaphochlamys debaryana TaxID=47281 RepID=A0A835XYK5_9CHLO|nr:hypothetical protein HYH03_009540 [Edaphochlamys debaryana]|eukprot:KAG2492300.1 hypothetical protein HYH03_009540 [Edaphochlamys debaryana]
MRESGDLSIALASPLTATALASAAPPAASTVAATTALAAVSLILPGFIALASNPRGCPNTLTKCNNNLPTCGVYRPQSNDPKWTCHRLYSEAQNFYLEVDEFEGISVRSQLRDVLFSTWGYSQIGSMDYADFGDSVSAVLLTGEGKWIQVAQDDGRVFTSSDNFGTSFPERAGAANGPFTLNVSNTGELMILNKYGAKTWTSVAISTATCVRDKRASWTAGTSDGQDSWIVCVCPRGSANVKNWLDRTDAGSVCWDLPEPLILTTETNPIGSAPPMAVGLPPRAAATPGAQLTQQLLDPASANLDFVLQQTGNDETSFWFDSDDYDTVVYYWLRLNTAEGLCATATKGGGALALQPCDKGDQGQHFLVERVTSQLVALQARVEFTKKGAPFCVEVSGASTALGATLTQSKCTYGVGQRFRFYTPPPAARRSLQSRSGASTDGDGGMDTASELLPWERADLDLELLPEWKRDLVEAYRSGRMP